MTWRDTYGLARQTVTEFFADNAPRLGAAMAFYTALSVAPLLLAVVGIAGLALGEPAARGELTHRLTEVLGPEQAAVVQGLLARGVDRGGGVLATVIGLVTLLAGATGLFAELKGALDVVWNVKPDRSGVWTVLRERLVSFTLICAMAFLLLVSLVFSAALNGLGEVFERWVPYSSVWMGAGNQALSLLVTTLMFATIFKVLPHARPAWSDVWIGAFLTAGLFAVGKYLIALYLGRASVGSLFGAAGSFVVLLVWVYYSAQILLLGAEFTQVYAMRYGSGADAVRGLAPADPARHTGAAHPARPDGPPVAPPAATPDPVI